MATAERNVFEGNKDINNSSPDSLTNDKDGPKLEHSDSGRGQSIDDSEKEQVDSDDQKGCVIFHEVGDDVHHRTHSEIEATVGSQGSLRIMYEESPKANQPCHRESVGCKGDQDEEQTEDRVCLGAQAQRQSSEGLTNSDSGIGRTPDCNMKNCNFSVGDAQLPTDRYVLAEDLPQQGENQRMTADHMRHMRVAEYVEKQGWPPILRASHSMSDIFSLVLNLQICQSLPDLSKVSSPDVQDIRHIHNQWLERKSRESCNARNNYHRTSPLQYTEPLSKSISKLSSGGDRNHFRTEAHIYDSGHLDTYQQAPSNDNSEQHVDHTRTKSSSFRKMIRQASIDAPYLGYESLTFSKHKASPSIIGSQKNLTMESEPSVSGYKNDNNVSSYHLKDSSVDGKSHNPHNRHNGLTFRNALLPANAIIENNPEYALAETNGQDFSTTEIHRARKDGTQSESDKNVQNVFSTRPSMVMSFPSPPMMPKNQFDELARELRYVKEEKSKLQMRLETTQAVRQEWMQQMVSHHDKQIQQMIEEQVALRNQCQEKDNQIQELAHRNQRLVTQVESLQIQCREKDNQIQELTRRNQKLMAQGERLQSQSSQLLQKDKELKHKMKQLEEKEKSTVNKYLEKCRSVQPYSSSFSSEVYPENLPDSLQHWNSQCVIEREENTEPKSLYSISLQNMDRADHSPLHI